MTRPRILIFLVTILTMIWMLATQPVNKHVVEVPYCPVTVKAGGLDELGNRHIFWAKIYRPCTELDRYENI